MRACVEGDEDCCYLPYSTGVYTHPPVDLLLREGAGLGIYDCTHVTEVKVYTIENGWSQMCQEKSKPGTDQTDCVAETSTESVVCIVRCLMEKCADSQIARLTLIASPGVGGSTVRRTISVTTLLVVRFG